VLEHAMEARTTIILYRGASGAPPLYAFGRIPGFDSDVLLEVQPGTQNAFPVRQILFKHAALGIVPVPILDSMLESPGRLTRHLEEQELDGRGPSMPLPPPKRFVGSLNCWDHSARSYRRTGSPLNSTRNR
jgi:hypothetical protein